MAHEEVAKIFACPQCPKIFATRSNLKRHMENPNIHNIPYVRSRDQKRWKGHAKKVVSKEETTERMRKWRAENREKNRQNDLRCRVYRLARQKFGEHDSPEKQAFVRDEIARRLGRRMGVEQRETWPVPSPHEPRGNASSSCRSSKLNDLVELPFYSGTQQKIELPSIDILRPRQFSPISSSSSLASSPMLPCLSPSLRSQRRTSSSSISSMSSVNSEPECLVLPPMHTFLPHVTSPFETTEQSTCIPAPTTKGGIKYVEQTKILDEFVGVVLNYADATQQQQQKQQQQQP